MKRFFLIACFIIASIDLIEAQVNWQWAKKIPHQHSGSIKTGIDSYKNIYVADEIDSPNVSLNTPIIYKLDSNGIVLAQHTFPTNFWINDLEINTQDQLVITGDFTGTLQFGSSQFTSAGSTDVFIGAFATDFQFIWGKRMGGTMWDLGYASVLDNNDNIFICGMISDTLNFEGTILNCQANGNSFVARFNLSGQLDWVLKDSTHITHNGYISYDNAREILINNNNELLVTGQFDNKNYFVFNGVALTIPQPNSPGYSNDYAFKLDLNGNCLWGKCIGDGSYGFNSTNSLIINYYTFNGSNSSEITLLNNNGVAYKTIKVDSVIHGGSWTKYLGTINDRIYLLASKVYYDQFGTHQPNFICTIKNDELVIIDSVNGKVWYPSLLETSNKFYLCGIFNEILCAGTDTVRTDSIGNYNGQYNYYASNPFIAKFTLPFSSGITDETTDSTIFQVFPNPAKGSFTVKANLKERKNNYNIRVLNTLGQSLFYKQLNYFPSTGIIIDIRDTNKGIYFLEIEIDNQRTIKKIVLQ